MYLNLIGPKLHTLLLQPGKESKYLVGEIWCHIEDAIIDLKTDPIKTTILGQDVEIFCDIEATQVWFLYFEFSLVLSRFPLSRETDSKKLSNFTMIVLRAIKNKIGVLVDFVIEGLTFLL